MVDRIGQGGGGGLAENAILSALKAKAKAAEEIGQAAAEIASRGTSGAEAKPKAEFQETLAEGLKGLNNELHTAERLPEDLLAGKINDFHEVAVQIKKADLSFKFAMEIRNKLLESYREVMRMNV